MSTKVRKRDNKKRTKTLEDDLLLQNKAQKKSMNIASERKLTTTKVKLSSPFQMVIFWNISKFKFAYDSNVKFLGSQGKTISQKFSKE